MIFIDNPYLKFNCNQSLKKVFYNNCCIKEYKMINKGYSIYSVNSDNFIATNDIDTLNGFTSNIQNSFVKDKIPKKFIEIECEDEEKINILTNEIFKYLKKLKTYNTKVIFRNTTVEREIISKNQKSFMSYRKPEIRIKSFFDDREYFDLSYGITGSIDEFIKELNYIDPIRFYNELYKKPQNNLEKSDDYMVLMSPSVIGFICHEAIGHLVEADHVLKGSIMKNLIGRQIAPDFVSIIDDGNSELKGAGNIIVDDEGNQCRKNYILKNGILNTFLTDSKYAKYFNLENTCNYRSDDWNSKPIIRMTNTYIENGYHSFSDLLSFINDGVYLKDVISGNCYLDGSIEILVRNAYKINRGRIVNKLGSIKIKDNAVKILNNILLLGNDLTLSLGTSRCGKSDKVKVDGGGPHLIGRCYLEVI